MSDANVSVLSLASLFPTPEHPQHGIFVQRRLQAVTDRGTVKFTVQVPVPWFPLKNRVFGPYSRFARLPDTHDFGSLSTQYCRYLHIPKFGMRWQAQRAARAVHNAVRTSQVPLSSYDIIDAQYGYPDGVAAAWLARQAGKPLTITVRGSDVTEILPHPSVRAGMLASFARADRIFCVADALRDALIDAGVPAEKLITLRNGVDAAAFGAPDPAEARAKLGLGQKTAVIVTAGWLIARKRIQWCIRALSEIKTAVLLIAGEGPDLQALKADARALGCADRVRFLGPVLPDKMPEIMAAGDVFALASEREGWPNVALEALATGCPVVATHAGSVRDFVRPPYGQVVPVDDHAAFLAAIRAMLNQPPKRADVRHYASQFDWSSIAKQQASQYQGLAQAYKCRTG